MKYVLGLIILLISVTGSGQSHSLEYFIEQARLNNPVIKGYQNQVQSLKLDSLIFIASNKTRVDFTSSNYYAPVVAGWGYDEAITNIAQLQALVQATKNFLSKGNKAAELQAISLESRALRDSMLLSQRDLAKTIIDQYITAYGDMLTMDNGKELFNLLKAGEDALKKLTESSVIKQTEFLAYEITMQQQELTWLQAELQYNTDYLTLNYLAGIMDTTIVRISEPQLKDSLPHNIYTTSLLKRFETDSLRIENQRLLINYSYRPAISAFADGGYTSSLQFTPYKNFGYSFGVSVKMPLYDSHQKRMKYQKLDLDENTRLLNKNYFISQYQQQMNQLVIQLRQTDQLFEKIKKQVEFTRTLIQAYEKLLQTGDVKVTELIVAITNYVNAQNTFRQNQVSRLKIIGQINYWNY